MGFFKKTFGKSGGGILAGGAGLLTGGIATGGAGLLGAAGAGGFLSDPFGTQAQVEGLRAAGRIEEAALLQAQQFQQQGLEAGRPSREAAGLGLEQLTERISQPLGESARFQANLQAALGGQQAGLARFGLGESSTAGLGAAQLTSNLALAEEQERLGIAQFLAGGALTGFGPALGGLQAASGIAGARAQTAAEIGGAKAAGKQAAIQTGLDIAGLFVGRGGGK